MDIESIQKYVTLFKDIITCLSAIIVAKVAILGLATWKKQIKGKSEYDLAYRLLHAIYTVREEIAWFRNPANYQAIPSEILEMADVEGEKPSKFRKYVFFDEKLVFQNRWQKIQDAFIHLDSVSIEAEVYWGNDVRKNIQPLKDCAATLATNYMKFLGSQKNPNNLYDADEEKKIEKIIYDWPNNPDNNFSSNEIAEAVHLVEEFVKPRLKLQS